MIDIGNFLSNEPLGDQKVLCMCNVQKSLEDPVPLGALPQKEQLLKAFWHVFASIYHNHPTLITGIAHPYTSTGLTLNRLPLLVSSAKIRIQCLVKRTVQNCPPWISIRLLLCQRNCFEELTRCFFVCRCTIVTIIVNITTNSWLGLYCQVWINCFFWLDVQILNSKSVVDPTSTS